MIDTRIGSVDDSTSFGLSCYNRHGLFFFLFFLDICIPVTLVCTVYMTRRNGYARSVAFNCLSYYDINASLKQSYQKQSATSSTEFNRHCTEVRGISQG